MILINSYRFASAGPAIATAWNPLDKSPEITLSGGNLIAGSVQVESWESCRADISKASGKWYFEVKVKTTGGPGQRCVGVGKTAAAIDNNFVGVDANAWGHLSDGYKTHSGFTAFGTAWDTVNDVFMLAWDATLGRLWFGKNGVWMSGSPAANTTPVYTGVTGTLFPMCGMSNTTESLEANFGATAFAYGPPSGFSAWG